MKRRLEGGRRELERASEDFDELVRTLTAVLERKLERLVWYEDAADAAVDRLEWS